MPLAGRGRVRSMPGAWGPVARVAGERHPHTAALASSRLGRSQRTQTAETDGAPERDVFGEVARGGVPLG